MIRTDIGLCPAAQGMIDASVKLRLESAGPRSSSMPAAAPSQQQQQAGGPRIFRGKMPRRRWDPSEIRVAPLELKTGKSYHGHRAQVALYMLLMADRYTADVSAGLLWYMHEQKPQGVQYIHLEVASLIQVRNGLAAHLASRAPAGLGPSLPPMLQDPKACGSCFQREACMLLHKGVEGGTPETAGAGNVFDEDTSHLRRTHTEFLRRWMALVQAEEQEGGGRLADVWALSSDEKVAKGGTCVGRLHLLGRAQEPATVSPPLPVPGCLVRGPSPPRVPRPRIPVL